MEILSVKNLNFRYNNASDFTLKDINLTVNQGDFILIIGESGSGKTTLLRMLKKELTPFGEQKGEIFFKGNKLDKMSLYDSSGKIGFIMQDPDNQIVTDKVYSELSFGLENLGYEREVIRTKVSEFASYFGLKEKFNSPTNTLSGGEKQLLNLAAVMAINPELLILDEPTAMLDPISAQEFLNCLKRLNDDLGTTIIIAEHHLSDILQFSDRVVYIEGGQIKAFDEPRGICKTLKNKRINRTFPASVRIFNKLNGEGEVPLNVKEGKIFLQKNNNLAVDNSISELNPQAILSLKDIWFRYERKSTDILKGCNLTVGKGEIYAMVGANGSGKSTLVNIISGVLKPYRGRIKCNVPLAVLPQSPKDLFIKDSVEEDFKLVCSSYTDLCEKFSLTDLLKRHPYDLSGGELQRAAIVKIMLTKPSLILLDEPTKGLDSFAKKELGDFLSSIQDVTILIVTHDLEFAADYADRCGLLFDGRITGENMAKSFFLGNNFYTTSVVKMTKGILDGAVTVDDIDYVES